MYLHAIIIIPNLLIVLVVGLSPMALYYLFTKLVVLVCYCSVLYNIIHFTHVNYHLPNFSLLLLSVFLYGITILCFYIELMTPHPFQCLKRQPYTVRHFNKADYFWCQCRIFQSWLAIWSVRIGYAALAIANFYSILNNFIIWLIPSNNVLFLSLFFIHIKWQTSRTSH